MMLLYVCIMGIAKRILEMRRNARVRFRNVSHEGPFDIEISSEGVTARFERSQNEEAMAAYNKRIKDFWNSVQSELQSSADLMVRNNKHLSSSIKGNLYYQQGEVFKLGFSFRPEGVYIHKGVGRGYIASGGSVIKTAKTEGFNRHPKIWFNPVIERNLPLLKEIILDYHKDLTINTTRIFIR